MKISIKTIQGLEFEIEVNRTDTILDLRKSIETNAGFPAVQQMLVRKGKVLKDPTTLEQNNVAEDSFILMALTKARAQAAPPAPPIPAAQQPVRQIIRQEVAVDEATIAQLLDLGGGSWDRDTVVRALMAAYNNPDRAVEYLYTGLPARAAAASVPAPATASVSAVAPPTLTGQQIQSLRAMVKADPKLVDELTDLTPADLLRRLFQEGQNEPTAAEVADAEVPPPQKAEAADTVMAEETDGEVQPEPQQEAEAADIVMAEEADAEVPPPPPPQPEAPEQDEAADTVTAEESEAIDRLVGMGFDRAAVMEVFVSFGRDEEQAANYLLDNM